MLMKSTDVKHLLTALMVIVVSLTLASVTGASTPTSTQHRTVSIDGLDIFYREAGPKGAPTVVLLHGFPTSSQMFRNLIPALSDTFHVVAPDYLGFGNSSMPTVESFDYTLPLRNSRQMAHMTSRSRCLNCHMSHRTDAVS